MTTVLRSLEVVTGEVSEQVRRDEVPIGEFAHRGAVIVEVNLRIHEQLKRQWRRYALTQLQRRDRREIGAGTSPPIAIWLSSIPNSPACSSTYFVAAHASSTAAGNGCSGASR